MTASPTFPHIPAPDAVPSQCGAICYRLRAGKPEVLLITTRGKGRWVIPKGWPISGLTPAEAASVEAWEEAGVLGPVHPPCLGQFSYIKRTGGQARHQVVGLYALEVTQQRDRFPERGQRKRRWVRATEAARLVAQPGLAEVLARFDPGALPPAHLPRHGFH